MLAQPFEPDRRKIADGRSDAGQPTFARDKPFVEGPLERLRSVPGSNPSWTCAPSCRPASSVLARLKLAVAPGCSRRTENCSERKPAAALRGEAVC
ncbi:hypothetical protein GCM10010168_24500 [Actinoplanes ianthinogenes]|uniref:Uncharacterized protein n=1 Tax=Actinoplanes ianthinogenes TaxID=122358 RepID=A0ABM7M8Z8_9ACTN|nr:hypothetical protein Aiant_87470 [Actinoplanes ianthinogenes]GGR06336.1 hypothetical protein GCM10010168_24500 [Actinoplanes ianthinogenes]